MIDKLRAVLESLSCVKILIIHSEPSEKQELYLYAARCMIISAFVCNDFYNYVFYHVLRPIIETGHIMLYEMVLEQWSSGAAGTFGNH